MRVVSEIPNPHFKITVFSWNNKYLIKLEKGHLEQTYKVSEMDVTGDDEIVKLLDDTFIQTALKTFDDMNKNLYAALEKIY